MIYTAHGDLDALHTHAPPPSYNLKTPEVKCSESCISIRPISTTKQGGKQITAAATWPPQQQGSSTATTLQQPVHVWFTFPEATLCFLPPSPDPFGLYEYLTREPGSPLGSMVSLRDERWDEQEIGDRNATTNYNYLKFILRMSTS